VAAVRSATMASAIEAPCDPGGTDDERIAPGARVLEAADIVGTYDCTLTTPLDDSASVGIGWIADGDELYVQLTVPAVALQGALRRDGRLVLGGVTTGSDVVLPVSASGRVRAADGVYRIEVAIAGVSAGAPDSAVEVVMERPIGSDLRHAHGRFRLDLVGPRATGYEGPTTLEIVVPVDASGSAYLAATSMVAADERVIAQLRFALVDIAPSGRFHLEAEYVVADGCDPMGIIGTASQWQVDGEWPLGPAGTVTRGRSSLLTGLRTEIETNDTMITRIE
ncbi:MAG: hypothetical protein ABIR79_22370, partial [Candidatus Binatia bacterium]